MRRCVCTWISIASPDLHWQLLVHGWLGRIRRLGRLGRLDDPDKPMLCTAGSWWAATPPWMTRMICLDSDDILLITIILLLHDAHDISIFDNTTRSSWATTRPWSAPPPSSSSSSAPTSSSTSVNILSVHACVCVLSMREFAFIGGVLKHRRQQRWHRARCSPCLGAPPRLAAAWRLRAV